VVETQVIQTFGQSVCAADGHLDRRALGRVVFEDAKKLDQLEKILHPKVREEVARRRFDLEKSGFAAAFYDVPLLFEKNMEDQFDAVLVVSATEKLRRERVRARTGLSDAELDARFKRQLSLAEKEKRASAVVDNNGSEKDLETHLRKVLEQLEIPVKNPSSGPA
jgi:dephospho-CoA kinase